MRRSLPCLLTPCFPILSSCVGKLIWPKSKIATATHVGPQSTAGTATPKSTDDSPATEPTIWTAAIDTSGRDSTPFPCATTAERQPGSDHVILGNGRRFS